VRILFIQTKTLLTSWYSIPECEVLRHTHQDHVLKQICRCWCYTLQLL
jgi:hypothetical protein